MTPAKPKEGSPRIPPGGSAADPLMEAAMEAEERVGEVTGEGIRAALTAKFKASDGWAVFHEVRDTTGYMHGGTRRYADMLVMGTWPSRGLEIEGFELKDARSDWLRELKEPGKAETISKYCDRWWLISAPGVAKIEEIPTPWGWMEHRYTQKGVTLRVMKRAPKLEPTELSRGFLASLLRELCTLSGEERISRACAEAATAAVNEERQKAARKRVEAMPEGDARALEHLRERVRTFEKASGVTITLNPAERGATVREALALLSAVGAGRFDGALGDLISCVHAAARAAKAIRAAKHISIDKHSHSV